MGSVVNDVVDGVVDRAAEPRGVASSAPARRRAPLARRNVIGPAMLIACGIVSVLAAPDLAREILVAALMVCAGLGRLLSRRGAARVRGTIGVAITICSGLAVCLLAPNGLGSVPVLAGAAILPRHVPAGWRRDTAIGVVAVAFGVVIMVITGSPIGLLAGVGAWLIADNSIQQASLRAERDRAVVLLAEVEASRRAQQEAAATEERNRIAREMHDVLAHSLAGLSIQLQAIRAVAAREGVPASVTGPLDRAAELARDGVLEARASVGALRAPARKSVDDVQSLVDVFPGQAVLEVTGSPARVDPEVGHVIYRAVQEALTNAARYATGSVIAVEVAWAPAGLRVCVTDDGVPPGHRSSGIQGSGTGLAGMTERVESVGGALTAGPRTGRPGWCVEVQVPSPVRKHDVNGGPAR
jgi:signal transduction histidine kinase